MVVRIIIRHSTKNKDITINLSAEKFQRTTVLQLKVEFEFLEGIPVYQQRLIFNKRQLEDDKLLSDYGITDESVILFIYHQPGGGSVNPRLGGGGMGDKRGKNRSMDKLSSF